ncbi:transglycosylase domain-containing protein [Aciduricibacillus chroicocephali]|uniref:Transglycosylase domain-containing protein n=1 Tax=Aciduricibacillus chroicocephali TaxID=3054939 RepID=A0ABY9KXB7_9BACI|nr:transglycosylase domain-containing protein [Bacillaceae bacterium 44XB]
MDHKENMFKRLMKKLWNYKKIRTFVYTAVVFLLLFGMAYAFLLFGGRLVIDEKDLILNATTTIETEDGETIKELYEENRKPIAIEEVPPYVPNAFIAIEDQRFREHGGIDFRSIMRAIVHDLAAGSKAQGASTITQQVVKNLSLSQDKTWMRKTKEMMAAIYLDKHLTKDEILELYLNAVYFGQGAYGVEQAAHVYFGKSAQELTTSEAAMLAGMVKSPTGYSPVNYPERAKERRNLVISQMYKEGYLSAKEELRASGQTLGLVKNNKESMAWADSFTDYVMKEAAADYGLSIEELKRGGYKIKTSIDPAAQKAAYEKFQDDAYFSGNTEGVQGALTLMNEKDGSLVALIGGRDYQLGNLNRVNVLRQPGSTMKPLAVYGPAMMKGKFNPYSLLIDQKRTYNGYTAANYDGIYENAVTMYEALIKSKNAPAVWLLNEIGVPNSKKYLKKMDIDIKEEGLGIALGGLEKGLSPIQIAGAYRTFIHEGKYVEPHAILHMVDSDGNEVERKQPLKSSKVFSKKVAWNMVDMMESTVQEGTAQAGMYDKALAGKTGTTQHPLASGETKDAWFAGVTPEYSLAIWMGYDMSDADHYLTGGSEYPTKLAKSILSQIDEEENLSSKFQRPKGIKELQKPIHLPEIHDVRVKYNLGGSTLVKARISWQADTSDDRVVYRVYEKKKGEAQLIGETKGKKELVLSKADLFKSRTFYVVPYDPLTRLEGERSKSVELGF